jgi:hypothetical protein
MNSEDVQPPPKASDLSKVPSWLLVGFVVGALFVGLLRRDYLVRSSPVQASGGNVESTLASPSPAVRPGEPSLSAVEAIWSVWGEHAVWVEEVTQISIWNTETLAFTDFFEVTRRADSYFFRCIPRLSRPVVDRGLGKAAPIQFTGPPVVSVRRP